MFNKTTHHSANTYIIKVYEEMISLAIPFIGVVAGVATIKISVDAYEHAVNESTNRSSVMVTKMISKTLTGRSYQFSES